MNHFELKWETNTSDSSIETQPFIVIKKFISIIKIYTISWNIVLLSRCPSNSWFLFCSFFFVFTLIRSNHFASLSSYVITKVCVTVFYFFSITFHIWIEGLLNQLSQSVYVCALPGMVAVNCQCCPSVSNWINLNVLS